MKPVTPIKRSKELLQLSRDHHYGLLLCWKIRTGLAKNIELARIQRYVVWFYEKHLIPHFEMEEKYIFPLLGGNNPGCVKACGQHRQIQELILTRTLTEADFNQLQSLLTDHIRFEERILFNEIQQKGVLKNLEQKVPHGEAVPFCENDSDPFWR